LQAANQHLQFHTLIDALCRGALTQDQIDQFILLGPEALRLVIMSTNVRLAAASLAASRSASASSSTPSAMVAVYQKPSTPRRTRKPGAKVGHVGKRRELPDVIDAEIEH